MCGIFAYSGEENSGEKQVWEGLKKLEYRGYDSFGIYSKYKDAEKLQKFVGKVSDVIMDFEKTSVAIGHTRWATHGKVEERNTHPHVSNDGRFVLVHNGIFENYSEVGAKLQKNNYNFYSETDTEVLVNYIENEFLKVEKKKEDLFTVVKNISKKVKGANAFVVYDKETGDMVSYKNGSPLFLGASIDGLYISSDHMAFPSSVDKFYELKDGEVVSNGNLKNIKWKIRENNEEDFSKNNFESFMLKEIFDQRKSIKNAYMKNFPLTKTLEENWHKNKKIFATGCGTAYNAAQIFATLASQKNIFIKPVPGNEWEQIENLIDKNSVLFCFSQSGETIDLVLLAKKFKERGGKVFSIINREFSSLKNISDKYFLIGAGQEIAVASTKAFTGMVAVAYKLLGYRIPESDFKKVENYLKDNLVLSKLDEIVEKFYLSKSLFVLGKDVENYMALETALKIKEVSYIHTEGFAAGELKHGVIALIETGILTIVLGGSSKYISELTNSITQITTRCGEVLFIGETDNNAATYNFSIPKTVILGPILATIVGQVLAYKFACKKELNPDKPRNLAKSVTVK